MPKLDPKACVVVIVDVQEKLAAAMPDDDRASVVRAASVLLEGARLLGARAIATEQYPQGLGPTVPALREILERGGAPHAKTPIVAKLDFSACDEPAFQRELAAARARTAIVVGMEAHVCVFQTVRELAARGVEVLVPLDGVASRRRDHRDVGLDLCRGTGATITTMESVVFDWLGRAGTPEFKALSKLIR